MNNPNETSGFRDVDRAQRPELLVHYLDTASSLAAARAYKREALALLDLHAGDLVLDVGCGTGDDVRALAAAVGPAGRAIGIDRSATMVATARERSDASSRAARFLVADACRLCFPDATFDACRADRVLQHLDDPRRALEEMVRLTRPRGRIVVSEPDWEAIIVDAPDQSVTQRVLQLRRKRIAQPHIGRLLPALFRELGLADVAVVPNTAVLDRYDDVEKLLGLRETAVRARWDGLITAVQAEAWLASLAAADRAGSFFATFTIFTVKGCKGT